MSSRRDLRSFIHTPPASSLRPLTPLVLPVSSERSKSDIFGVSKVRDMVGGGGNRLAPVGAVSTQNLVQNHAQEWDLFASNTSLGVSKILRRLFSLLFSDLSSDRGPNRRHVVSLLFCTLHTFMSRCPPS